MFEFPNQNFQKIPVCAAPELPALQTLEVPLDGANTADS